MQQVAGIKKVQAVIIAVAMAAVMAFAMGLGAQKAFAEDALPYNQTASVTVNGSEFTFMNKTPDPGVTLVKMKSNKKSISVPATVTINGMKYNVGQIGPKAFKGTKAKTITLPATVKTIKKQAFKGSKATKLVLKTTKLTKSSVKKCLKGSKIKVVKAPKSKKAAYKKIFTKKNCGKKVKVK